MVIVSALCTYLGSAAWAQEAVDIEAAVTTNRALLADGTADAITDLVNGGSATGVGVGNMVLPADNPPAPTLVDGISQTSNTDNTPAIDVGPAGEVRILNGGDVTTSGLNAPGITVDPMNGALSVDITTGGTISTTGNGSAGIETGAFDTSVFNLRVLGDGMSTAISTQGDNANAISLGDGTAGGSAATLGFQNTTLGTTGAGSDIISAAGVNNHSYSLAFEGTTLTTTGTGSSVVDLSFGSASDAALSFFDTGLQTSNANAHAISLTGGQGAVTNTILLDSQVTTTGMGAQGVRLDIQDQASTVVFIDNSTFTTTGSSLFVQTDADTSILNLTVDQSQFTTSEDNATAIVFGRNTDVPSGSVTSTTVTNSTVRTIGQNAEGVFIGALGNISARDVFAGNLRVETTGNGANAVNLQDDSAGMGSIFASDFVSSTFSTEGDNAVGLIIGGRGSMSDQVHTFDDLTISTMGNDSGAYFAAGQTGDDSTIRLGGVNGRFTTQGDRSIGLEVGSLPGTNSEATLDFDNLMIETAGTDAIGFLIGSPDPGANNLLYNFSLRDSTITTTGAMSDAVRHMPGLGNYAIEIRNSDLTTTGANALGFALDSAAMSNTTVFIADSQFNTTGSALSVLSDNTGSILSLTATESQFSTSEDNASAIVFAQSPAPVSNTIVSATLTDLMVSTQGSNSEGIFVGAVGDGSVRSFTGSDLNIMTVGDGATGLHLEDDTGTATGLFTFDLNSVDVSTMGNSAAGIMAGGLGTDSTAILSFDDITVSTQGNDSTAYFTPGLSGENSSFILSGENSELTTVGDRSLGIEVGSLPSADSDATLFFGNLTIETAGTGSTGILINDASMADLSRFLEYDFTFANGSITTTGAMSDAIQHEQTVGQYQHEISSSQIMATGAGSRGLVLFADDFNGTTVLIDGSSFETSGSSILFETTGQFVAFGFTAEDSQFTTTEDDATAIVLGRTMQAPSGSVYSITLRDLMINTSGANSEGVFLSPLNGGSVRTFVGENLTVQTTGNGATALNLEDDPGATSASLVADILSSEFSTQGDGAVGIFLGGTADNASQIFNLTDVSVMTQGDDAGAFVTPGQRGQQAVSTLNVNDSSFVTMGDRSIGIDTGVLGGSMSTATVFFEDVTVETSGENASGIVFGGTEGGAVDGYFLDAVFNRVTITTRGDEAPGFSFAGVGAGSTNSTSSLTINALEVTTEGANSNALEFTNPDGLFDFAPIIASSMFQTRGEGSIGLFVQGGNRRQDDVAIVDTTITTRGSGIVFDALSDGSTRSVMLGGEASGVTGGVAVTTVGDMATGVHFGGITGTGELEYRLDGVTVETRGDMSDGLRFEAAGAGSSTSIGLINTTVDTLGDTSRGIFADGVGGTNSDLNIDLSDITIATTGLNASGFLIDRFNASGSTSVLTLENGTITTEGDNAPGLIIGAMDAASAQGSEISGSTATLAIENLTISTAGENAHALGFAGLGDGAAGFDIDVSLQNVVVETGGANSNGIDLKLIGSGANDGMTGQATLTTVIANTEVSTSGDGSTGLSILGAGPGGTNLQQSFVIEGLEVETSGVNAHAVDLHFASSAGPDSSFEATAQLSATATGAGSNALQVTGTGDLLPFVLSIEAGDALSSADGFALLETGMHTTLNVEGMIAGDIDFGTGDDDLTFTGDGLDLRNLGMVDGGAGTDTARFDNASVVFERDVAFVNFEGPVTAMDTTLTLNNVSLDLNRLVMTGMSRLNATGMSTVGGDLRINGTLSQSNGQAGDTLTIDGDLGGTFTYEIDAQFDAPESVDLLTVAGSTTEASSTITVENLGGLGSDTGQEDGDGILIVDVGGASEEGDFVLDEDVQAGVFTYGLQRSSGGDFFLQTLAGTSDAGLLYSKTSEIIFSAHDTLLDVPLHNGTSEPFGGAPVFSFAQQPEAGPDVQPFIRAFGGVGSYDATTVRGATFEATETDFDYAGLQFGTSIGLPSQSGSMAVYIAGHTMTGSQDVDRMGPRFGPAGNIDTDAYGAMLGWSYVLPEFGYVRASMTYSHADHDFLTAAGAIGSTTGDYTTVIAEAGRHYAVSDSFTVTPWARIGYENADVSGFVDTAGTVVAPYGTDHALITLGTRGSWQQTTVNGQRDLFASLALSSADSADTTFALTGVALNDRFDDETFAEIDAGVAWQSSDGRFRSRFSIASRHGLSDADNQRLTARFDLAFDF